MATDAAVIQPTPAPQATSTTPKKQPTKPATPREISSRPMFKRTVLLQSVQAQRVIERSYVRTAQSMFTVEVILRIMDRSDFVNEMQKVIANHLTQMTIALQTAHQGYDQKMLDAGVSDIPSYSSPKPYELELTTPQGGQFINMIDQMDKLMGKIDALWMASLLDSETRIDETYKWQQMLLKMAGRIQSIESRARRAASQQGKDEEVQVKAPALPPSDDLQDDATQAMNAGAAEIDAHLPEIAEATA